MFYSSELQGKCGSCGYLSIRHKQQLPKEPRIFYLEIDPVTRKNGECPSSGITGLACLHRLVDFSAEISQETKENAIDQNKATVKRIWSSRGDSDKGCLMWIAYQPGFDPKEHFEEFKTNQLYQFQLSLLTNQHTANLDVAKAGVESAKANLEFARKNLIATSIFGVIMFLLILAQIGEVWYFSTRPQPTQAPIIFQYKPNTKE